MEKALGQLLRFQSSDCEKLQALQQLSSILGFVLGDLEFQEFLQIYKALIKSLFDFSEHKEFVLKIEELCGTLGEQLSMQDSLCLMMQNFKENLGKEQIHSLNVELVIMSQILGRGKPVQKNTFIPVFIDTFRELVPLLMDNKVLGKNSANLFSVLFEREFQEQLKLDVGQ